MPARLMFLLLVWGMTVPLTVNAMSFLPKLAREPLPKTDTEQMAHIESEYQRLVADLVVVKKSERRLYLVKDEHPIRSYPISLGFAPKGHKEREGDGRTPEGRYLLDWRKPSSNFYKAIHINYPNESDRLMAARQGDRPGGLVMIHGQPRPNNAYRELQEVLRTEDWTKGCIAVSNQAIDEIWEATRNGTPIEIRP